MLNGAELHLQEQECDREEISSFIRLNFRRAYGATLVHLMPRLFALRNREGNIVAAFGLREAAREPLFMEAYLDHPVEHAISRHAGRRISRASIIEVGNLATAPGGARAMIVALTSHLFENGFDWIVFTGVATLRAAFHRLGLRPFVLAEASPDRLTEPERLLWGDYFAARPVVMGGYVPIGYQTLLDNARTIAGAGLNGAAETVV